MLNFILYLSMPARLSPPLPVPLPHRYLPWPPTSATPPTLTQPPDLIRLAGQVRANPLAGCPIAGLFSPNYPPRRPKRQPRSLACLRQAFLIQFIILPVFRPSSLPTAIVHRPVFHSEITNPQSKILPVSRPRSPVHRSPSPLLC
jgi:hypothetical protein